MLFCQTFHPPAILTLSASLVHQSCSLFTLPQSFHHSFSFQKLKKTYNFLLKPEFCPNWKPLKKSRRAAFLTLFSRPRLTEKMIATKSPRSIWSSTLSFQVNESFIVREMDPNQNQKWMKMFVESISLFNSICVSHIPRLDFYRFATFVEIQLQFKHNDDDS